MPRASAQKVVEKVGADAAASSPVKHEWNGDWWMVVVMMVMVVAEDRWTNLIFWY